MAHAPGTVSIDTLAIAAIVKMRFPDVQNFKISLQGTKAPCWYATYQVAGRLNVLNFPGTVNQQQLITQLDAALCKAGLGKQMDLPGVPTP